MGLLCVRGGVQGELESVRKKGEYRQYGGGLQRCRWVGVAPVRPSSFFVVSCVVGLVGSPFYSLSASLASGSRCAYVTGITASSTVSSMGGHSPSSLSRRQPTSFPSYCSSCRPSESIDLLVSMMW